MLKKKLLLLLFGLLLTADAFCDDVVNGEIIQQIFDSFDMIWLIIAASLVFFMQAGFAMVETGLTRAKNAANIIMKNLMDFSGGAIIYLFFGWAIMYGDSVSGLFGSSQFFLSGADSTVYRDWMFQVVFAATAATIVSGAMAERTKFSSYIIFSLVISGIIYPVSGHWIWSSDGWLAGMGFHDFAGSTVVHSLGGWAALSGAYVLGGRTGKYVRNGKDVAVQAIPAHNLPLASLGVFILWFGWYGFNCGSTLSGTDSGIAIVSCKYNTISRGRGSFFHGYDLDSFRQTGAEYVIERCSCRLVGITAGCAVSSPIGSVFIGIVSGMLVVLSVEFIDKVLHVDDPVGAVSVHGVCGVWGTIAVGLFGNTEDIKGLFYSGNPEQLIVQILGAAAVFAWGITVSFVLFMILKKTVGLRVSEDEELKGLDITEHGSESYYGFQIFQNQ